MTTEMAADTVHTMAAGRQTAAAAGIADELGLDDVVWVAETPEMEVAWADVSNYAKTTGTFWVTKEHVYIPPPIPRGGTLSRQAWLA